MNKNETKLIVENWRKFISNPKVFKEKNEIILSSNILIENKRFNTYFNGTFGNALNEVRYGNMSAEVLLEQVVNDFENEMLINENVFKTVKDWADSGVKKLTAAVKDAFERINQMYQDITLKVWNIITTGISKLDPVKNAINKILSKLEDLKDSNPIMFKIMIYVSMIIVITAIMMLTAKSASAQVTGVKPLQADVALGYLKDYFKHLDAFDFKKHEDVFKMVSELKQAILSKQSIDPKDLSENLQFVLNKADAAIKAGKAAGPDSVDYQWVEEMVRTAKNVTIKMNGQSIK